MSVLILSARHCAAAALWCGAVYPDTGALTVARMLARANALAFARRYGRMPDGGRVRVPVSALHDAAAWWAPILQCEAEPAAVVDAMRRAPMVSAAYAHALLACAAYQCADLANGHESAEVRRLEAYRSRAALEMRGHRLSVDPCSHVWAI